MGCVMSQAEKEAAQKSLAIDKTLASENVQKRNEVKLLLLGKYTTLRARARAQRTLQMMAGSNAVHSKITQFFLKQYANSCLVV